MAELKLTGLIRTKPPSQIPHERKSEVFRRAVAELKADRSPGRNRLGANVIIDVPLEAARSVTPRSCTVRSSSPAASHTTSRRPPPVEPFSVASGRKSLDAKSLPYERETYFTGHTLQEEVVRGGNAGSSMHSRVPRLFQRNLKLAHNAEPAEKIVGLSREQLRRPNSGVGFAMTTPRTCVFAPGFVDPSSPRVVHRSIKFHSVDRPAVWQLDLNQKGHSQAKDVLRELRNREVVRVLDEWHAATSLSVEARLQLLGYSEVDATKLALNLKSGVLLHTLSTADRKAVEAFKSKLGEACIDRLRSLPISELETQIRMHAFTDRQSEQILLALCAPPPAE